MIFGRLAPVALLAMALAACQGGTQASNTPVDAKTGTATATGFAQF
jgi:hypothetical protein